MCAAFELLLKHFYGLQQTQPDSLEQLLNTATNNNKKKLHDGFCFYMQFSFVLKTSPLNISPWKQAPGKLFSVCSSA